MYITLLFLILFFILFEPRVETFVYSGSHNTVHDIALKDDEPDMSLYKLVDTVTINSELIEDFVILTNKYIYETGGIHNYIIETKNVKQYKHTNKNHYLYRCEFMCVKPSGFAFGFSVVSDIIVIDNKASHVIGVRSQELNIQPPSDTTPFVSTIEGSKFVEYTDIKNSELDLIKK